MNIKLLSAIISCSSKIKIEIQNICLFAAEFLIPDFLFKIYLLNFQKILKV